MDKELMEEIGKDFHSSAQEMADHILTRFQSEEENQVFQRLPKIELESQLTYLIQMIGEGLSTSSRTYAYQVNLVETWGKEFGKTAVKSGITVDKGMKVVPYFRKVLFIYIRASFKKKERTLDEYFDVANIVHPFIDRAIYGFTEAYVEYNNETFQHAKDELLELSVPVVPLTKEVAILPIIGSIDTCRSAEMLDQSLTQGRELGLSYLIIDLSGVHMIDTAVAHNLFQLNDALNVVGITAVFSGLRPELAQTVVSLGISFKHITVTSTLERALEMTGLAIEKNN